MLRMLFSRLGEPHAGSSGAFSFNLPEGMCPVCEGTGRESAIDVDALVDRDLSLNEGAITVPNFTTNTWYWRLFTDSGFLDPDKKLRDYTEQEWEDFLHKPSTKVKHAGFNATYEGLVVKVKRIFIDRAGEIKQAQHQGVRRAGGDLRRVLGVRWYPARGARAVGADQRHDDRGVHGDAGERPARVGWTGSPSLPWRRWSGTSGIPSRRSSRSGSATSPSTASRAHSLAARRSGPRWSATSGHPSPTSPTSSTSPPSGCTRTTSSG